MNSSFFRAATFLLALTGLVGGCDTSTTVKEITETRELAQAPPPPPANVSSADRFGMRMPSTPAASASTLPFTWTVPQGWTTAQSSQMRLVNLVPGGDPRAECYLSVLPGGGGGVAANVNRWRSQMSLQPYTSEEFAALPSKSLMGAEATFVEFEGTYKGMRGDQNEPDYKLVGLILPISNSSLFIKMLGPKDLIDKEIENFNQFSSSLRLRQDSTTTSPAPNQQTSTESGEMELQWTAPEGWHQGPNRPMRAVTFTLGPDGATECYVSVFPGDAGGVEANVNRWARQMNVPPLDAAAFAALPKVSVMGSESPLVEFSGHFIDTMSGIEIQNSIMLGVIAEHGGNSIFIKLVGPAPEVTAQKQNFIAFCQSLRH